MILSEVVTLIIYCISITFLPEFFGEFLAIRREAKGC